MKQILLFSAAVLLLAACSKGNYETVPTVTIKSFGPDEVVKGQQFKLVAEITDKEGDVLDSMMLIRHRYTGATLFKSDTTRISMKGFANPKNSKVDLEINFTYGEQVDNTYYYREQEPVDRGLIYGLIVFDKAKNKSEYKETRRITLKKV